jgi:hypothetical protein
MNRRVAVSLLLVLSVTPALWAHGTIDQSHVGDAIQGSHCGTAGGSLYQSFQPAATTLAAVDLFLWDLDPGTNLVTIRIRSGGPTGVVLATAKAELRGELAHLDLPTPLNVLPHSTLTIEWLDRSDDALAWKDIATNNYLRGTAFGCTGVPIPGGDRLFRTYSTSLAARLAEHGTVDQDNTSGGGSFTSCGGSGSQYQSFTPSVSPLQAVELSLVRGTPAFLTSAVRIRQGSPGGAVLATASTPVPASGPTHFDLPSPLVVLPETPYVIEWVDTGGIFWSKNPTSTYPRGQAFGCTGLAIPTEDFRFRTFSGSGGGGGGGTGSAEDPRGDGAMDLLSVTAFLANGELEVLVGLSPFDPAALYLGVEVDADRNQATGFGGTETVVAYNGCASQSVVGVYDYTGSVVTQVGEGTISSGPNAARLRVPQGLLGGSGGPLDVRVFAQDCTDAFGVGIDTLPDRGLPLLTTGTIDPPAGPWLTTTELAGFRVKARILGSPARAGTRVDDCIGETLCIAGAIADRAEVLVRVPGPRPNGYLWPTLVKLNTTAVEVWIEQIATAAIRYYFLRGSARGVDELPGLVDRLGFQP